MLAATMFPSIPTASIYWKMYQWTSQTIHLIVSNQSESVELAHFKVILSCLLSLLVNTVFLVQTDKLTILVMAEQTCVVMEWVLISTHLTDI